jgi:leucyl-tRNA synthetase
VYDNLATIDEVAGIDAGKLTPAAKDLRRLVHRTIKKVTEDIDGSFHFNTAIAAVMELVNGISVAPDKEATPEVLREAIESVVRLMAPFVPHICEELWQELGYEDSLEECGWPVWDEDALLADTLLIVVQVNGKVRGKVTVPADADKDAVEAAALADTNVIRFIEGKIVRKVIVVPGRLVNIVIG